MKSDDILSIMTKSQLACWEAAFQGWHTPDELKSLVYDFGEVSGNVVVTSPRTQFFRDSFVASKFAEKRHADRVRLLHPKEAPAGYFAPDCEIEFSNEKYRYEIVEADRLERKRGDEYRADRASGVTCRDDIIPTPLELQSLLTVVCAKKASKAKTYHGATGLVISLNTWALMEPHIFERNVRAGTEAAGKAFKEVWLLNSALQLIWKDGNVF